MLPHFAAVCKRGGQILRRFPVLTCRFGSVMLYSVQRFAWKEGTPGWAGTAAFSLKKATPKHFRLEVYPFVSFSKTWSIIFSAAQLCCGAFLFCREMGCSLFFRRVLFVCQAGACEVRSCKSQHSSCVQHKILGCPQSIKVTERCTHCPSSRNCWPNTLHGCAGR